MIYLVGIVITFFLAFLLLGKKNKNTSDNILLVWFVVIGVHLVLFYLNYTKIIFNYPFLLGIVIVFPFVHGPLLYLYTATLTHQINFSKKYLLHFMPVLFVMILFYDFFILDGNSKLLVYQNKGIGFQTRFFINSILIKISGITYIILSQMVLHRHKKNIISNFSNLEKINLNWLQYLILGVALVWIFIFFEIEVIYLYYAVVAFVIFMGYFGINQVGIFNTQTENVKLNEFPDSENSNKQNDNNIKYRKSGLDAESAKNIYYRLNDIMQKEEVFLNSDINLIELSQILEVHPNHLSQVINSFENKNFYDYINGKRIEKFIALSQDPKNKNYTIISLAYDCGFNSKSSFNKQFKKHTGQTPSEFMSFR